MGTLESLAQAIFIENPAVKNKIDMKEFAFKENYRPELKYVLSHAFKENNLILLGEQNSIRGEHFTKSIIDLVSFEESLGPNEIELIKAIICHPDNLLLVVGPAGCGKTSTVLYVANFLSEHMKSKVKPIAQWKLEKESYLYCDHKIFRNFVYIEFNSIQAELKAAIQGGANRETVLNLFNEILYDTLFQEIEREIESASKNTNIQPDKLFADILYTVFLLSKGRIKPIGRPRTNSCRVMTKIGSKIEKIYRGRSENKNLKSDLDDIINCLSLNDKFHLLGAFIEVIDCDLRKFNNQLTIFIDNIDPLPGYVQETLKERLMSSFMNRGFKTVVSARLPSSGGGAFTHVIRKFPHTGPMSTMIIASRLLDFLRAPNSYLAYKMMEPENQFLSECRAIDLLMRISIIDRKYRPLHKDIKDLTGSSIRRALIAGKYLLTCDMLPLSYGSYNLRKEICTDNYVEKLILCIFLRDIGQATISLVEGSIGIFKKKLSSTKYIEKSGELLANRIFTSLRSINFNIRTHLGKCDVQIINRIIEKLLKSEIGKCILEDIEYAASMAYDAGEQPRGKSELGLRLSLSVIEAMKKILRSHRSDAYIMWHKNLRVIFELYFTGINKVAGHRFETQFNFSNVGKDCYPNFKKLLNKTDPNKLSFGFLANTDVVNVFLNSSGNPSSCTLRIIYRLAFARKFRLRLSVLLRDLNAHNFEHHEILTSVNDLTKQMSRVIWINEQYDYDSYERLEMDGPYDVKLTKSGKFIFNRLIRTIPYIFAKSTPEVNAEHQYGHTDLTKQLDEMQNMMELLFRDEEEKLNYRLRSKNAVNSPTKFIFNDRIPILSMSLDISTSVVDRLIKLAASHFKNVVKHYDVGELNKIRSIIVKWYNLFELMITSLYDIYNREKISAKEPEGKFKVIQRFRHSIETEIKKDIKMRRASGYVYIAHIETLNILNNALKGQTFWVRGMDEDEFLDAATRSHKRNRATTVN